ncbi:MAG: hemolysin family protein [Anaerolineae bacterium]
MDEGSLPAWLALVAGIGASGLAAAAEVSLEAISGAHARRLVDEGTPRERALQVLLDDLTRFRLALLLLTALAWVVVTTAASWLALRAAGTWNMAILLALLLAGLVIVLVQTAARTWAARWPEPVAVQRLGGVVQGVALVLTPLVSPLHSLARLLRGPREEAASAGSSLLSDDGLRYLINTAEEPGLIEAGEKKMIASIFELGEMAVRVVMVPRIDVVAVPERTTLREVLDVTVQAGHSRIPVYHDTIDNIQGVLYAKDLLLPFRDGRDDLLITELMRPAYFVPESKRVDDLLQELQQRRVHMAIVVDEYGGTAGVVTIEDLLEEIVGDIQDEYDSETPMSHKVDEREFVFDGQIRIDEVNEILDVDLPSEENDTLGGFIYSELGAMPAVGSRVVYENLTLEVQKVEGRRIVQVRVVKQLDDTPPVAPSAATRPSSLFSSSTS